MAVLAAAMYGKQTGDCAPLKALATGVGDLMVRLFAKSAP